MDKFESHVSDLDLALVFAELAANSSCAETRRRNVANAREAFLRRRNDLCLYSPDNWQYAEIEGRLRELGRRLRGLGERFSEITRLSVTRIRWSVKTQ